MRDTREVQPHLYAAEGSGQHEVVEVADMPTAENLALKLAEAGAERHVEPFQNHTAKLVCRVTRRCINCGYRVTVFLRIEGHNFEVPSAYGAPRRLAVPLVPLTYIRETFLAQHLQ